MSKQKQNDVVVSSVASPLSKYGYVVLTVGLILTAGVGGYFYLQYRHANDLLQSQAETTDTRALIASVGKLIELPTSETPTVATVSDVNKLKGQAFFVNARNGDKVLIYTVAKKAIVYRPSDNKIIEVGPINLPNQQQVAGAQTTIVPSVSLSPTIQSLTHIALYNGTATVGLTKSVGSRLTTQFKQTDVPVKENANKITYVKTIVVDLSGKNGQVAQQIANYFHTTVTATLPEGEITPKNSDLVVILGTDVTK